MDFDVTLNTVIWEIQIYYYYTTSITRTSYFYEHKISYTTWYFQQLNYSKLLYTTMYCVQKQEVVYVTERAIIWPNKNHKLHRCIRGAKIGKDHFYSPQNNPWR
jgi:hypothetical protein